MARPKVDSVSVSVTLPTGLYEVIERAAHYGFLGSTPAEVLRTLAMQSVTSNPMLQKLADAAMTAGGDVPRPAARRGSKA